MQKELQKELQQELEARVIERAKFWDGFINMLIKLRDSGLYHADRSSAFKVDANEDAFRAGMQQAINAAYALQQKELAECFMLAGVGGQRATEFAKERARRILGEHLDYALQMGYIPTFWVEKG